MQRILVAEDEPGIALVVEDSLRLAGYEVQVVSNGLAAREQIGKDHFDLILLDGMLPGKDGFEVCRELRRECVETPVIFLSARAQVADRVQGLDLGANDYVTKPFSLDELLARVRRHLYSGRQIHDERRYLAEEMRAAFDVQQKLFPGFHPLVPGLDYAALCRPAREVSGDYYDFIELEDGRLGVLMADVCGKGISAALLGAALHGAIRAYAPAVGLHPGQVFARTNRLLFETTAADRYATAFYGVYDPRARTLTYANAGHYPPWVLRHSGVERLHSLTTPLGLFPKIPPTERIIHLDVTDWLLIVSDGIPEARDAQGREFGDDRLLALFDKPPINAFAICHHVMAAVAEFSEDGCPPGDDLTVLAGIVLDPLDRDFIHTRAGG